MSVKGMVTEIAEGTMIETEAAMTGIDMTTAETEILTIILKAMTNRDSMSESW